MIAKDENISNYGYIESGIYRKYIDEYFNIKYRWT